MVIAALPPIAAADWTREAARTGPGSNPGGHGRAPAGPRRKTWVRFTRVGQAGYNSAVTRAPACAHRPRRAPPANTHPLQTPVPGCPPPVLTQCSGTFAVNGSGHRVCVSPLPRYPPPSPPPVLPPSRPPLSPFLFSLLFFL